MTIPGTVPAPNGVGIAIRPLNAKTRGSALLRIAAAFRALRMQVVGRLQDDVLILDFRCPKDSDSFRAQLDLLGAQGHPV